MVSSFSAGSGEKLVEKARTGRSWFMKGCGADCATLISVPSVLTRVYQGKRLVVGVLDKGFEYEGRIYGSLTALAKVITGSHWNGRHFFGLAQKEAA